jgi:UDP-N-acetylglucosamine acyltransferase
MIHATAVVDASARVAPSASIGPYCIVGANVTIGEGARLLSHVVVDGPTTIGARVIVHPFAVLGGAPQDRSHAGEATELFVGDDTVIREHATLHRGTRKDRGKTIVGARCLVMVGVHVAHDVVVGDDCTIANACQLAGHCVLEDGVTMGGAAALAPFVRIGEAAFVAAGACVEHDVPPFHIAQGDRARVRALNTIGLRRRNVPAEAIEALERAHKLVYRSGAPIETSLVAVLAREDDPYVRRLVEFLRTHTTLPGPARG